MLGEIAADLEEERGLADAGLAADQDERAQDDPAAQDLVEFLSLDLDPRLFELADVLIELGLGGRKRGLDRGGCLLQLLDHAVPLAAARTSPEPFRRARSAGLANEDRLGFVFQ